jgi:hypothetical protein
LLRRSGRKPGRSVYAYGRAFFDLSLRQEKVSTMAIGEQERLQAKYAALFDKICNFVAAGELGESAEAIKTVGEELGERLLTLKDPAR